MSFIADPSKQALENKETVTPTFSFQPCLTGLVSEASRCYIRR